MVLKIKISHEQTVHEKSRPLYKNSSNASVSLNHDKEAAASNSLPSSSSELEFIGRKKKATKPQLMPVGLSYTFYQVRKATRSFSCTLQHYGLDCSFTKEQLILGGKVDTTCHSRK